MNGILVGYDGSGHSLRALEWAAHEAVVRQEPLTVVCVCQDPPCRWAAEEPAEARGSAPGPGLGDTRHRVEEQAAQVLQQAGAGPARPRLDVRAVAGEPADQLLSAAEGADMLVVGSRGAGGFAKLRLGSVSSHLTHRAHCPVVVVPDDGI